MEENDVIQVLDLPELRVLDRLNGITNGGRIRAELDAEYCLKTIAEIKEKLNELVDSANKRRLYLDHILERLEKLEATTSDGPPKTHRRPPSPHILPPRSSAPTEAE